MTDRKKKILLVLLGVIFMMGMLGTSLFSFIVSRASLRTQVLDSTLPQVGDTIYSEIQRDLLRPIFISSLMADNTFVHDWVEAGEADTSSMARYLSKIQSQHGTLTAFFVSEKTNNYYHPSGILKRVSEDEPRDAWYFRVREMGPEYEINVDPDLASADVITVFVNYRVLNSEGTYIGAIGIGLAIDSIARLVQNYSEAFNRVVYFVDGNGAFTLGIQPHGRAQTISEIEGLSGLQDRILSNRDELALNYQRGSDEIFLNSRYIKELDWLLMVEQREALMAQSITKTLIVNLLASLGIALAFLWVASRVLFAYRRDMESSARYDKLTGTYNRHAFEVLAEQALKFTERKSDQVSMMLIDIDHFKSINDQHGHLVGDDAIQTVVNAIEDSLRDDDSICRWGGEEFCVLLKNCDVQEAARVAEKIRRAVERLRFSVDNVSVPMTVSIGVAQSLSGENLNAVFARIDDALYAAKHAGRNQVQLAARSAVESIGVA